MLRPYRKGMRWRRHDSPVTSSARELRRWQFEAHCLRGLQVDDRLVLGWLLDRKLGPLEARRSQRIRPSAEPPLTLVR